MNDEKTEFIVFTSKRLSHLAEEHKLSLGDSTIKSAGHVCNSGAYCDKELKMDKQISEVSRICFYHLRNISRIRKFLTEEACKTL